MIVSRGLDALIIVVGNANEDADLAPILKIEDHAGVLDRFPRRLEKQTLLRINIRRFAWRDPEELRIEQVDLFQKPTAFREGLSGNARLRIVESLHIPPIRGNFRDRVPSLNQQVPEGLRVTRATGKTAADS